MMSDLEYTFREIHETATKLANLTEKPELGLSTYLESVGFLIDRLEQLRTVQRAPATV